MEETKTDSEAVNAGRRQKIGYALLGASSCLTVGLFALTAPFLLPAFRRLCLPYVPATATQVKNVMKAVKESTGGKLIDLGSGDGRIVLEAALTGQNSVGVELNPWLVLYSRLDARLKKVHRNTAFHRKDLWRVDLSPYSNIVIFGVENMMEPLEKKLGREICDSARVITCRYPLPNWEASATIGEGLDTVWVYRKASTNVGHSK